MNEITPTRRAMFGVIAAVPMLGAVPAMALPASASRAEWERVAGAWRTARNAASRFDVEHVTPAYDAFEATRDRYPQRDVRDMRAEAQRDIKAAREAYKPLEAHYGELLSAVNKAAEIVVNTMPPDARAFAEKIEIILIDCEGAEMSEEWHSILVADARRFSGLIATGGLN